MSKLIRDWAELAAIPQESETHILEIDIEGCNGWLEAKNPIPFDSDKDYMSQALNTDHYLSTHTFYGETYQWSTKILQTCGFDVELANWDEEVE